MKKLFRTISVAVFACTMLALAACNTTKGFGEDVDSLGENMSHEAEEHGAR
jgi:predicted small secreted protein